MAPSNILKSAAAIATVAVIVMTFLSGCGSDTMGPQLVVGPDTMVCLVDGSRWVAGSKVMAASPNATLLVRAGGKMVLWGYRWTAYEPLVDEEIRLHCDSVIGPGAYAVDSAFFVDRLADRTFASRSGRDTIRITTLDIVAARVVGTFSFTATDEAGSDIEVTAGHFNVAVAL